MMQITELPRIPAREPDTHKGTYGRVLILAGSPAMPGAAVLAARAALRAGSGLVTVAAPPPVALVVGAACPEATHIVLPEPKARNHREALLRALGERLESGADSLALGPGIGTSEGARALVELALQRFSGPHVVDADGLNLVAAEPALQGPRRENRIWTPHPGELQRLTGEKPRGDEERVAASARFVERFGGVVVLKGHRTVVMEKDRYYINATGNPGMATGGAGDVLTGVIASLLGQGFPPFPAACLSVRIHGRAGDLAARALGQASLIASDIIEHLPQALQEEVAT